MTWLLLITFAWAGDFPVTPAAPASPVVSALEEPVEVPVPLVVVAPMALAAQVWFIGVAPGVPGAVVVPLSVPLSGHYGADGGWVDGAWKPPVPASAAPAPSSD